jgi:hypothetical protein
MAIRFSPWTALGPSSLASPEQTAATDRRTSSGEHRTRGSGKADGRVREATTILRVARDRLRSSARADQPGRLPRSSARSCTDDRGWLQFTLEALTYAQPKPGRERGYFQPHQATNVQ